MTHNTRIVAHLTTRSSGPGLTLLAPFAERERYTVRGVPKDLRQQVKAAATLERKRMSRFIVVALWAAVAKKGGR